MEEEKSKSQAKRDAKALQDLGSNLSQLSLSQLAQMPLPQTLLAAIIQIKKINSHSAKKRHMKFMGQLLRGLKNITPIQNAYDKILQGAELNTAHFHLMEKWRSRLLSDDKEALTEFIKQYPCDDTQQLRVLIRKAKSERDHQKNLGASKTLFRFIRDLTK